jgi:hypothetical protein
MTQTFQRNSLVLYSLNSWIVRVCSQAADITTHEQIEILFSNYTWARDSDEMTVDEYNHVKHWMDPYTKAQQTIATTLFC